MKPDLLIAPSLLAADFSRLGEEIENISSAGADWIHLDVMDGHFVENISFGSSVISALRNRTEKPFDCHLMVSNPDKHICSFSAAGCDMITIHAEAVSNLHQSIKTIKDLGKKVGISLKPETCEEVLYGVLDSIDIVLLMAVNPGAGGQVLMPEVIQKIQRLRKKIGKREVLISVDGGVNESNAGVLKEAGANVLIAGSSIFQGQGLQAYQKNIMKLRNAG